MINLRSCSKSLETHFFFGPCILRMKKFLFDLQLLLMVQKSPNNHLLDVFETLRLATG